jgi:hypothetical protein
MPELKLAKGNEELGPKVVGLQQKRSIKVATRFLPAIFSHELAACQKVVDRSRRLKLFGRDSLAIRCVGFASGREARCAA